MSLSSPFIERPVATTLICLAIGLSGVIAYPFLSIASLPQVDYPAISVNAALPGASPETMASSVATPLERQLGHIAGVNEMTSSSSLGSTGISLQFDLNRNIDAAARDVQAAINAARSQLPAALPQNPFWRKTNPADTPILFIALTSDTLRPGEMYDVAIRILQQKLSQVNGVAQVIVQGSSLPGVRVDVNPTLLNKFGLSLEDVRTYLGAANANRPKGDVALSSRTWSLSTNDQLMKAAAYAPLVIAYQNGGAVKLSDVARVTDSVEDIRTAGWANGKAAIVLLVFRQPGANVVETVDRVYKVLPRLQAAVPPALHLAVLLDSSVQIRATVLDVERTLMISIILVIFVVLIFLRSPRTTFIPSVAVPLSLAGSFGILYLFHYSLDNLSLMALTIATGFVVDDAIVVIENITRYIENGMSPMHAALEGAKEIGPTVLSISISLNAVFIPIFLMTGYVGRLFREFAFTLSAAIVISLFVSLTLTPMMCSRLLRRESAGRHGWLRRASELGFDWIARIYDSTLRWVLRHQPLTFAVTLGTIALTMYLYVVIPKGFFPQQDTGRMTGQIQADMATSLGAMRQRVEQAAAIIQSDPAVENVMTFLGGAGGGGGAGGINNARMFITLNDISRRKDSADQVIARLRPRLARVAGASVFLQSLQTLRIGTRIVGAQYQYTLQSDNIADLNQWASRVFQVLRTLPQLADVNIDQQNKGLESNLVIDRNTAARFGISPQLIDDTLYDAFGQRQVSTLYTQLAQYHVVMEADPIFWQNPEGLRYTYVRAANGSQVPLSAFTHYVADTAPLAVNHQGQFPSATISFNLPVGTALSDAVPLIEQAERQIGMPSAVRGSFSGTAQAYQDSLSDEPILIAAALICVYLVLGMLYESLIHPVTILSTLPSAGVGALLALLATRNELNVISLIGIILLIGIVKKNAIIMIDFALKAEREGASPREAIYQACVLRFRPITMTTMAAMLGGLPMALGTGNGSEIRRPLGIAIVGGLLFSQMLTLYTTPVMYLYLDRLRLRWAAIRRKNPRIATA
jgi:hydrophobe/amphiphile efflux-1 (HAE1) family protein